MPITVTDLEEAKKEGMFLSLNMAVNWFEENQMYQAIEYTNYLINALKEEQLDKDVEFILREFI
jgi:hypothetical protein